MLDYGCNIIAKLDASVLNCQFVKNVTIMTTSLKRCALAEGEKTIRNVYAICISSGKPICHGFCYSISVFDTGKCPVLGVNEK